MKLWLEPRPFSWTHTYCIFEENGDIAYKVSGEKNEKSATIFLHNRNDVPIGKILRVKKLFSPYRYEIYFDNELMGQVVESSPRFGIKRYELRYGRWRVFGNITGWDYDILDDRFMVMHAGQEYPDLPGKYVLDTSYSNNEAPCVLAALAMEAANSPDDTKHR